MKIINYPFSNLRVDLLDPVQTKEQQKITVSYLYEQYIENFTSPERLQNLNTCTTEQAIELITTTISEKATEQQKEVYYSYDDPNKDNQLPMISISPDWKLPGKFSGGRASKSPSEIREIKPHLREEKDDPNNHGYRLSILGQWFDEWLTFTCWARTTKEAYALSEWLETLITENEWHFTLQGINRILYQGRQRKLTKNIGNNVIYGYPIEYYLRTEKITTFSEKSLEQLVINISIDNS